jgi:hypothetical protein
MLHRLHPESNFQRALARRRGGRAAPFLRLEAM